MIADKHIQEFVAQAHRVGELGLTICSSGNLSWRIGDKALISGTGSWVPSLREEQVSVCDVATGEVLNGVKPSMESVFHLGVMPFIQRTADQTCGDRSRLQIRGQRYA